MKKENNQPKKGSELSQQGNAQESVSENQQIENTPDNQPHWIPQRLLGRLNLMVLALDALAEDSLLLEHFQHLVAGHGNPQDAIRVQRVAVVLDQLARNLRPPTESVILLAGNLYLPTENVILQDEDLDLLAANLRLLAWNLRRPYPTGENVINIQLGNVIENQQVENVMMQPENIHQLLQSLNRLVCDLIRLVESENAPVEDVLLLAADLQLAANNLTLQTANLHLPVKYVIPGMGGSSLQTDELNTLAGHVRHTGVGLNEWIVALQVAAQQDDNGNEPDWSILLADSGNEPHKSESLLVENQPGNGPQAESLNGPGWSVLLADSGSGSLGNEDQQVENLPCDVSQTEIVNGMNWSMNLMDGTWPDWVVSLVAENNGPLGNVSWTSTGTC